MRHFLPATAVTACVFLVACAAQRPVLYPNEHLDRVGPGASARDVDDCRHMADANVRSTRGSETARDTTVGAGIGAASGAVGGAIYGAPGTGAAVGAASGATAGLLSSLFRSTAPTPTYQSYVNACLADRGYRVVGWD